MAEYSLIAGSVNVDKTALDALRDRPTWEWIKESLAVPGEHPYISEHGDAAAPVYLIDFAGEGYRNLSRCLVGDLAHSVHQGGNVQGELSMDVLGMNTRTVASFLGDQVQLGTGNCFHQPVKCHGSATSLLLGAQTGATCECGCSGSDLDGQAVELEAVISRRPDLG